MSLFQKAIETYDAMIDRTEPLPWERVPLAPVSHMTTRAGLEVVLDQNGRLVDMRAVEKNEPKIIIPVTEASMSRTANVAPHPLCDNLSYIAPENSEKHNAYLDLLTAWTESTDSHPKLMPVLAYVRSGSILKDMAARKITADKSMLVCWSIVGLGENMDGPCWEDRTLMDSYTRFYAKSRESDEKALCMATGKVDAVARLHPKGVVPLHGNAKLISAKDSGFDYLGRFTDAEQALTVSYAASQKAHNALRWLVENLGVTYGTRVYVCWSPHGYYGNDPGFDGVLDDQKYAPETVALRQAITGVEASIPENEEIVVVAFDAITKGRLSVVYYNEFRASEFFLQLLDWSTICSWPNGKYWDVSPSVYGIAAYAFGTVKGNSLSVDDNVMDKQVHRLLACRLNGDMLPLDIERSIVWKASALANYESPIRYQMLAMACAVVRKYRWDHYRETWYPRLNEACTDRSYLFGRLLALAHKAEKRTYDEQTTRDTNAFRLQKKFSMRPMETWLTLEKKLVPYMKKLPNSLRSRYENEMLEIIGKLMATYHSAGVLNRPLDDLYLLGFYSQWHDTIGSGEQEEVTE